MPNNWQDFQTELSAQAERAADKQHAKGRLSARERVDYLLDKGSFLESGAGVRLAPGSGMDDKSTPSDGVITGQGLIGGRRVAVYAQDVTQIGGSLGSRQAEKIVRLYDEAIEQGIPVVGLIDSGGARIQEGLASLDGYGAIFNRCVRASGVIPQISLILGPAAGGAAYTPALTDVVCQVRDLSTMFITGPQVVRQATGEEVDFQTLGGAKVHATESGVAHFTADNEQDALALVRRLLSYLPSNYLEDAPVQAVSGPAAVLAELVPTDPTKSYDMQPVVEAIVDQGSWLNWQASFAANALTGLARINGQSVGIVANQPEVLAGCLDINASDKIARFVQFCDAFSLPLVNLIDIPGYLPGVHQETAGIIRHGAKVLHAYAAASVPKVALVLRKAYGGGYIALVSRALGYDRVYAWPEAQLAVMGAEQAVDVIHRRELEGQPASARAEKISAYRQQFLHPYLAAEQGRIDAVIEPVQTRQTLIQALTQLQSKRVRPQPKKHGNGPL